MERNLELHVRIDVEIISNTYERVTFVCEYPFSFTNLCTMSFAKLQNGLCENIQSHILKRFQIMPIIDDACMQHMLYIYQQTRFHVFKIELYVESEQHMSLDTEFKANHEVDDENDDGNEIDNLAVQNEIDTIVNQHPFVVLSFMRVLDLAVMHTLKFSEYANMGEGNVMAEDCEESMISAIKSYTISRGVDYTVYESEPHIFYAKCKGYDRGCDWLIRANLI
ncbi:hypothetical protein Ahy_A08g037596 [Arachis hypogaea]|uniref:Uncharacterized protein n=1 Tax=Arachis hypogaea TaxID=3818 RepID=A0A445BR92_ARAHY|nr:hypothetical protein Ahy_A08g037596 [Arachis hypogaea]